MIQKRCIVDPWFLVHTFVFFSTETMNARKCTNLPVVQRFEKSVLIQDPIAQSIVARNDSNEG